MDYHPSLLYNTIIFLGCRYIFIQFKKHKYVFSHHYEGLSGLWPKGNNNALLQNITNHDLKLQA